MKESLHFEEAVADGLVDDFHKIEKPLPNTIFIFIAALIGVFLLISFGRLLILNINWGKFYSTRAESNIHKKVISPAQRGLIFDRFEKPLLKNVPSFSVSLNLGILAREEEDNVNKILEELSGLLGLEIGDIKNGIGKTNLENNDRLIVGRNISLEQAINLKTLNLQGVEVEDDFKRDYFGGPALAHILGYNGIGDNNNEVVGISGLEAYYNELLRGQDGEHFILKDVQGNNIDKKVIKEAKEGSRLITAIDVDFQNYFYNRLQVGLEELGRDTGVGLAINPQTGEILSLVSLPSFDNNNPAKYLDIQSRPLFNRAVSGVYNPGSTIKPLMALIGLKEKLMTPTWETYSSGYLELPNPYNPDKPSRFLDWKAHGWVNLYSALARSSNVYFYIVGGGWKGSLKGLGIDKLRQYWEIFGVNDPTGVDLGGEAVGFLPNPEEKEKRTGQIWRIGDTYNVSIGQGDLTITPIRLLSVISGIANGGKIYKPFFVKKIIEAGREEKILQENNPEIIFDFSDWWEDIKEVQKGMRDAVAQPYGTANMLYDLPYKTSGKTGSAQISNNTKTNAFFVGYGPSDPPTGGPQIAILVLVENAKEGSINTLPIAYDVLKWYYDNRL